MRNQSIEIQRLWLDHGQPRNGPIYTERLKIHANYKREIKLAKMAPKQAALNRLHSAMASKDTEGFWKNWRSVYANKSQNAPVINGNSSKESITEAFKVSFHGNSMPNNPEKVKALNEKFGSRHASLAEQHSDSCNCKLQHVSLQYEEW